MLLVFDLTDRDSFEQIPKLNKEVDSYPLQHLPRILVGNKGDLEDEREVDAEEAAALADELGVFYSLLSV